KLPRVVSEGKPMTATRPRLRSLRPSIAIVFPPGNEEQERDKLCVECTRLPESTTRESATVTPAARRLRAALAALVMAVHLLATMSAHGQARLDAAGIQACASVARLISDLQSRTVPTAQARQRLTGIYDMARSSSAPSVRQIASMQSGQIAS